jgi:ammonia channel protein AmtB
MENEQTVPVTTRSVGMKYGLFMSVIAILYFVVMNVAGIDMSEGIGRWGSFIFYIVLIVLAHKNYKENGNGFMSYGEGMGITFWLALITSVISSVFTYIYIKFIDDSFVKKIMEKQEEAMADRGMSQEQIDQAMSITEKFMTPGMMFVFGLIGGLIMILICGLIITIFTKKSNPEIPV